MKKPIDRKEQVLDAARPTVFRKRRFTPPQAPDQARRQAELVQSALAALPRGSTHDRIPQQSPR
jgi:hypothetical protein